MIEEKVWQEFYCNDCSGGNYIMVKLNMALNHTAVVVCPMCGAKHERTIENGEIYDRGRNGNYKEEICPPKSACSKEPRHSKIRSGARDGAVVKDENDLVRDSMMRQLWLDYHGGND